MEEKMLTMQPLVKKRHSPGEFCKIKRMHTHLCYFACCWIGGDDGPVIHHGHRILVWRHCTSHDMGGGLFKSARSGMRLTLPKYTLSEPSHPHILGIAGMGLIMWE